MKIYLIRHGIAEPIEATDGFDDAARNLTDKGIEKIRRQVKGLKALGVELDGVWTSPYRRARQTAEIVAEKLAGSDALQEVPELACGGKFKKLPKKLAALEGIEQIALVGHNPDISELAGYLLIGRSGQMLTFKKGSVACIEINGTVSPLRGELLWFLSPKFQRMID